MQRRNPATWRAAIVVLVLLFGPAVVAAISRPVGLVTAAVAVVVLVYLVLKNEWGRTG